jgi:hypothetical protein
MHKGCLVRNSIVLKKEDSFQKLLETSCCFSLLTSAMQYLLWWLQPFPGNLQAQFNLCPRRQMPTPGLITYFCVLNLFDIANHCLHSLECSLVSGSDMWTQVSSIVMKRLQNAEGSSQNQSKMAYEAGTWSRFWQHWGIWSAIWLRASLCLKSHE